MGLNRLRAFNYHLLMESEGNDRTKACVIHDFTQDII